MSGKDRKYLTQNCVLACSFTFYTTFRVCLSSVLYSYRGTVKVNAKDGTKEANSQKTQYRIPKHNIDSKLQDECHLHIKPLSCRDRKL